ncbi:hypothetical protein RZS08_31980, partial [Arthrospira platensis SPKY1]|nr:hypothetical protein [Arthrospira platensis SPKY1]
MFNISNRIVTIPAWLHFLHGKESNLADLVLVYGTALVSGLFIGFSLTITEALLSGQKLVIILLILDFSGGIVANFTRSTRTY